MLSKTTHHPVGQVPPGKVKRVVTQDSRNASKHPRHVSRQQTPPTQTLGTNVRLWQSNPVGQVPPGKVKRVVTQNSRNASKRPRHVARQQTPRTQTFGEKGSTLAKQSRRPGSTWRGETRGHTGLAERFKTTASRASTTDTAHANIWGQMFYSGKAIP
ncbi:hypothetical protein RISK_003038 [Rhodopirellula islandica]|uniref:Uncharacterized protein n=1 Tax=Rhodopirellula islandica TaxID=595434 RepID=A0A0J1BE04_RHOIS|nr:hypothetical protein RISK_003038 [Rhodopirellula islandica]